MVCFCFFKKKGLLLSVLFLILDTIHQLYVAGGKREVESANASPFHRRTQGALKKNGAAEVIQSHAFSHIFTWFHTFSHIFTWFHMVSHIFTWFHGVKKCVRK